MITLVASLLIGGGCGALLGRLGLGKSSAGSSANNWKRSAVYGAALGFVICAASGCGGGPEQPPKHMKPIAEANFETEVTQAKMPVVVDFYAPWCGPCKVLSPRLDALAVAAATSRSAATVARRATSPSTASMMASTSRP